MCASLVDLYRILYCVFCLMADACIFLYNLSRKQADKEVCILQCAAARQPGGQKHIFCLSLMPCKAHKSEHQKVSTGTMCNVVTQFTVWWRKKRLWNYYIYRMQQRKFAWWTYEHRFPLTQRINLGKEVGYVLLPM